MTLLDKRLMFCVSLFVPLFALQSAPAGADIQTEASNPVTSNTTAPEEAPGGTEEPAAESTELSAESSSDPSDTPAPSIGTPEEASDLAIEQGELESTDIVATKEATPAKSSEITSVEAETDTPEPEQTDHNDSPKRWIEVNALLQSIFLLQNDSDFDPTQPMYDENGQTVGAFATLFKPSVTFNIEEFGQIFYDLELGLNVWSKNNPDQADPTADDRFFLKHRELWASGQFFNDLIAFKVGYQHFADPSGLFLNHWMGVASVGVNLGQSEHLWLSFGQVPDATYEGFVMTENNFSHDTFFFGAHRVNPIGELFKLNTSVFALFDNHVVGRDRMIVAPTLGAEVSVGPAIASLNATLQFGRSDYGVDGVDTSHLAWAIEAHGDLDLGPIGLALNALLLGADDDYDRNDFDGAFLYSGKNRSATVILTEDELRDRGDNLDERLGTRDGGFHQLRSGLAVADLRVEGRIGEFFRPALVAGAGFALASKNAGNSAYVGTELDLDFGFVWKDVFAWHVVGGIFLPGEAGAMLINELDLAETEIQFTVLSSLSVKY